MHFQFEPRALCPRIRPVIEKFIPQLAAAQPLNEEQVRVAVEQLADEKVAANLKADFLAALAKKGETIEEIAAFARALREKSIAPPLDAPNPFA